MLEVTDVFILTTSVFIIFLTKLVDLNPFPIFGIYQRPNGFYWFKVMFWYLILFVRKVKLTKKGAYRSIHNLETAQPLRHHEKAEDAVYTYGTNKNGDYIAFGIARRKNKLVDNYLYLKISNVGLLGTLTLPDTSLYYETDSERPYSAEGLKFSLIEPMQKWKLTYDGALREMGNRTKSHNVKIGGIWTSNLPYFDFVKDMDTLCTAKSIAYEKWNQNVDLLNGDHEIHYEQFGTLKVIITVNNINYNIELDSLRGHRSGKREWRQYKRYGMHFFTTENGDRFSLGKICKPITYSRFTMGYVYISEVKAIFPIQDCNFELYQHGAAGNPPKDYAFTFTAGGKKYSVSTISVLESPCFYISKDCEARIFHRLCKFEVNGIKGWGCAEWLYRNIEGKHHPDYIKIINSI